jgi:Putative MetA-pathway of phenol degradation
VRLSVLPAGLAALLLSASAGLAGPPYLSDDPEPTDYQHFEIYAFGQGTISSAGTAGETGIDFNYGGAPDLQLTAVLPLAYDEAGHVGLGNAELAAKYKFLHQDDTGWDVAVFPRVFLPSASSDVGDDHAAFSLPFWAEKDIGKWSLFGGGGCVVNRTRDTQNFCFAGWAVTREVAEGLRLGVEIYHQGADEKGGKVSTSLGGGLTYDINEHYHLLAYAGPGLENTAATGRQDFYTAILFTF